MDLDAFCGNSSCFDPKVIYDQYSGRFVAVSLEGSSANASFLHIMVSTSSAPTNLTTDWTSSATQPARSLARTVRNSTSAVTTAARAVARTSATTVPTSARRIKCVATDARVPPPTAAPTIRPSL